MAYNRYGEVDLAPLLAPTRLIPAADVIRDRAIIPDAGGIYGWWFDTPLPNVPLQDTLLVGSHRLLYIGIAPRAPSAAGIVSRSTLRRRITRNHLGNRIASSTLRRSLAALLREELDLTIGRSSSGKVAMPPDSETPLTSWMVAHAAISFMTHKRAWNIEDAILRNRSPALPFNIVGATHQFRVDLSAMRR